MNRQLWLFYGGCIISQAGLFWLAGWLAGLVFPFADPIQVSYPCCIIILYGLQCRKLHGLAGNKKVKRQHVEPPTFTPLSLTIFPYTTLPIFFPIPIPIPISLSLSFPLSLSLSSLSLSLPPSLSSFFSFLFAVFVFLPSPSSIDPLVHALTLYSLPIPISMSMFTPMTLP
jgi:hypothetical protein